MQLFRNMLKDTFLFFTLGPDSRERRGCPVLAEQDKPQPRRSGAVCGERRPSLPSRPPASQPGLRAPSSPPPPPPPPPQGYAGPRWGLCPLQARRGPPAAGAVRKRCRRPAGGAAGGGRALSVAALPRRRGLRRERSREAAVGGERGHGAARRDGKGPGRRQHGDRHRDQPQDPGEREAAGSLPLHPRQGPDPSCEGQALAVVGAPGSLRPPLRRGGGRRAAVPEPPSALPPAEGGGGVKPQPGRGYRELPAAGGLRPRGPRERESHCFGKRSRGPTVPRRAAAGSAPELEFSLCNGPPGMRARNRGLPGRGSSRSRAFWCDPRYRQVLSAAPTQQSQFENSGRFLFFFLAEPGMTFYQTVRDSFSLQLTSPDGRCLIKDSWDLEVVW